MADDKKFMFSEKWNIRFMDLAKTIAKWSKDESTKVGCVVVGPNKEIRSMGYNGFPRGVDDTIPERNERPKKYLFTEHAERNAIDNAVLTGTSFKDCVLYVTFPPCQDCARGIIQTGIREVIYLGLPKDDPEKTARWRESCKTSFMMFDESHILHKSLDTAPISNENIADSVNTLKLFDTQDLNKLSYTLIKINGQEFQSFICVEEINELVKEMVLNNSFENKTKEIADFIITRNHVVCAYNLQDAVAEVRAAKLRTYDFMNDKTSHIVALLDMQKSLTKHVNRNASSLKELTNRIADSDVAVINHIVQENCLPELKKFIDEKIQRTIQREIIAKGQEYK